MSTETKPIEQSDLDQFIGTENYYKNGLFRGFVHTDGIQFLADSAGAYWFIDLVASHQMNPKVRREPFQLWTVKLNGKGGATVFAQSDTDSPRLCQQYIEYTDWPESLQGFQCYVERGSLDGTTACLIMMLKTEH